MIKRFATLTAGLIVAFGTLGSPAQAATHHRAPNASEKAELAQAQRATGKGYTCHLEWDGPAYDGYEAICEKKHAAPDANEKANLAFAKRATGSDYSCALTWAHAGYNVTCSREAGHIGYSKMVKATETCKKTGRRNEEACVKLYMRPSQTSADGSTYTPYGFFLVAECTDQYRGVELRDCLRQPAA